MPLPVLAAIGTGITKLVGSINKKVKAKRAAKGKSGGILAAIGGGIANVFKRKNKSQKLQQAASKAFAKKVLKDGKQARKLDEKFVKDYVAKGGTPQKAQDLLRQGKGGATESGLGAMLNRITGADSTKPIGTAKFGVMKSILAKAKGAIAGTGTARPVGSLSRPAEVDNILKMEGSGMPVVLSDSEFQAVDDNGFPIKSGKGNMVMYIIGGVLGLGIIFALLRKR